MGGGGGGGRGLLWSVGSRREDLWMVEEGWQALRALTWGH